MNTTKLRQALQAERHESAECEFNGFWWTFKKWDGHYASEKRPYFLMVEENGLGAVARARYMSIEEAEHELGASGTPPADANWQSTYLTIA